MVDERKAPEGYKVTEVGIMPDDWEVKKLGEVLNNPKLGGNYSNSTSITQYPLIKMGNISRGSILVDKIEFIEEGIKPSKLHRLKYGDVLFNTRNTLDLVGKVGIWKDELPEAYYNSNLLLLDFHKSFVASTFFMNYVLNIKSSIVQLRNVATGTTSVAAIYSRDLYKILVPLPPKPEQKSIAEALSNTDSLIQSIEKLIDKKKKIKQGTMQQLLTGKKRLPGFSGEWRKVKVKDIGYAYGGLSGKSKSDFDGGNKPYITFLNVMNNTIIEISSLRYVRVKSSESQNRVNTGDLLFNTSSETPEEVGMCSVLLGEIDELYLNSFCFGFRIYDQYLFEPLYLAYFFRSNEGRKLFFSLAQGATRYNLSKNLFYNIEFKHPSIQEQKAIAQVLSDMDNEIEALEEKLEKYKTIKQGMMQELLTGRIRLI